MKVLIISDIHGSSFYSKKIKELNQKENPNKIILLGDLYYHGPRNPLTEKYEPMEVAKILNSLKDKIIAVKGNCDADVDEMISDFKMLEKISLDINGYRVFCSHGHKYNINNLPEEYFDIMFYGHFHTGFIEKENGRIYANPGSISLPKNNSQHSYLIFQDKELILKDIDGNIIQKTNLGD